MHSVGHLDLPIYNITWASIADTQIVGMAIVWSISTESHGRWLKQYGQGKAYHLFRVLAKASRET